MKVGEAIDAVTGTLRLGFVFLSSDVFNYTPAGIG